MINLFDEKIDNSELLSEDYLTAGHPIVFAIVIGAICVCLTSSSGPE